MAVEVDIANGALIALGARTITDLKQADSKEARICNARFVQVRRALQRSYLWSFCLRRAALAASTTVPAFGFSLSYPYPAGAIRIMQVGDFFLGSSLTDYRGLNEAPYQLEGRQILTNLPAPLNVRYMIDVTDASQFDDLFAEAMSYRLAWAIAPDLTLSLSAKDSLKADFAAVIGQAVATNAIEKPPVQLPDDSFITSRL